MKKTAIIIAIMLGITLGASAQNRGLFGKGPEDERGDIYFSLNNRDVYYTGSDIDLPGVHGTDSDYSTPLGTGALLLIGFGAAYALKKKASK